MGKTKTKIRKRKIKKHTKKKLKGGTNASEIMAKVTQRGPTKRKDTSEKCLQGIPTNIAHKLQLILGIQSFTVLKFKNISDYYENINKKLNKEIPGIKFKNIIFIHIMIFRGSSPPKHIFRFLLKKFNTDAKTDEDFSVLHYTIGYDYPSYFICSYDEGQKNAQSIENTRFSNKLQWNRVKKMLQIPPNYRVEGNDKFLYNSRDFINFNNFLFDIEEEYELPEMLRLQDRTKNQVFLDGTPKLFKIDEETLKGFFDKYDNLFYLFYGIGDKREIIGENETYQSNNFELMLFYLDKNFRIRRLNILQTNGRIILKDRNGRTLQRKDGTAISFKSLIDLVLDIEMDYDNIKNRKNRKKRIIDENDIHDINDMILPNILSEDMQEDTSSDPEIFV